VLTAHLDKACFCAEENEAEPTSTSKKTEPVTQKKKRPQPAAAPAKANGKAPPKRAKVSRAAKAEAAANEEPAPEDDDDEFQDAGAAVDGSDADASQMSEGWSREDDHHVEVQHFDREVMEHAAQSGSALETLPKRRSAEVKLDPARGVQRTLSKGTALLRADWDTALSSVCTRPACASAGSQAGVSRILLDATQGVLCQAGFHGGVLTAAACCRFDAAILQLQQRVAGPWGCLSLV
jgi:hypothetical protein